MTTESEQPAKFGRLSVNINDHTANVIRREQTYEADLNATEIVARAIQLYGMTQEARRSGSFIGTLYRKFDWFGDRFWKPETAFRWDYPAGDGYPRHDMLKRKH